LNDDGEILAQVAYAVRNVSARTLNDILFRRTGIGTLGAPGDAVLNLVARTAARELRWSEDRIKKEMDKARTVFQVPGKKARRGVPGKKTGKAKG
jgi:glycerol-3-phosphate dehydrogenase